MTELLFYNKPVPLAKDAHQNLRFQKQQGYSHASKINTVPLSGNEFFPASRDFPIMFAETGGRYIPVALLALTAGGHQLGESWSGFYTPEFVKRYPFALAQGRDVVMIDESAPHFSDNEGEKLFDHLGEPTDFLKGVLQYLDQIDAVHKLTMEYTFALKVKGLLVKSDIEIKRQGKSIKLDDFYVVDGSEFHGALTDEEILDWYKKGWIGWTYAHLHSIGSVSEVVKRMVSAQSE